MSCGAGKPCQEFHKRRIALLLLGVMALIFVVLSAFSFLDSRQQVTPAEVSFAGHDAVAGKRVFQAYNCMGCHTLLGNGAYFGPDLTNIYGRAGPAWLAAFLPSAASWPTAAAVRTQLAAAEPTADARAAALAAYVGEYPGAAERIERRGGGPTLMPNLPLSRDEVGQLIAFFKYTSAMNTEGWPPTPKVDGLRSALAVGGASAAAGAFAAPAPVQVAQAAPAAEDPVAQGERLVREYACVSCHALDRQRLVGPGWGGLYGSQVSLADGKTAIADDAFLAESILRPEASLVAGYPGGVMPAYDTLSDEEVGAMLAFIRSLGGEGK